MNATTQTEIIRSDMSCCQPSTSLTRSRMGEAGKWRLMDYETKDGLKGTMAFGVPGDNVGEITLPLEAAGTYRIYLGFNWTKSPYGEWSNYGQMRVKLSGDQGYSRFGTEAYRHGDGEQDGKVGEERDIYTSIHEVYWKTADVTNQSLILSPMQEPYNEVANLSYVKLVQLTEEDRKFEEQMKPTEKSKNLGMIWCTGELTGHTRGNKMYHPTSEQWFKDEIQSYAGTDFGIIMYEAIRGNLCTFKTKIGDVGTPDRSWPEEWVDPLRAFTDVAHENGIKLFASMRMIGGGNPVVFNPINWANHYFNNLELAKIDKEGLPCANLSLAYPQVRQHWLGLLREALEYGVDGVHIHLNRSQPPVMYEKPVVEAFVEQYSVDPLTLDESDPRWEEHTAGYLTQFLREVRALVDEKPGREVSVMIKGYSKPSEGIKSSCDVDTWIKEGLIDYLLVAHNNHPSHIQRWKALGGDRLRIWASLMPRTQSGYSYATKAKAYYEAGADGFCFWDGERRPHRASEWAVARMLGHRDQLDELTKRAPGYFKTVPLRILGGISIHNRFRDG